MLLLIFIHSIMSIYGFVLRDSYNLLSKDSADYKIDIVIDEDEYEMIDKNQLRPFNVDKKQFEELDKLARMEYTTSTTVKPYMIPYKEVETTTNRILILTNPTNDVIIATYIGYVRRLICSTNRERGRYSILDKHGADIKKRETTKHISHSEYNYNELLNEYYDLGDKEVIWQDKSGNVENVLHAYVTRTDTKEQYDFANVIKSIFLPQHKIHCSNKSIGYEAIKCFMSDYNNQQRPTKEVMSRFWRIFQIWFLVYLVVAVPLWCTRGWCCCCLFCKFFKPRQTIDEAKKYLTSNPPGVLKTKSREIHYNPTEREKETYEEFEHFIKNL